MSLRFGADIVHSDFSILPVEDSEAPKCPAPTMTTYFRLSPSTSLTTTHLPKAQYFVRMLTKSLIARTSLPLRRSRGFQSPSFLVVPPRASVGTRGALFALPVCKLDFTRSASYFTNKMASNPPGSCCYKGIKHDGEPTGELSQLGDFEIYTKKPDSGDNTYGVLMYPSCLLIGIVPD